MVATDFPPSTGGISTYSKEIAKSLLRTCNVTVLALGISNGASDDKLYPFRIIRTPPVPILREVFIFIYLPWLLRRHKIDAVLHAVWPSVLVSHIYDRLIPVPYFVAVHASEILDDQRTWRRKLKGHLKPWRRAALKKAKGIFPVSHYSAGLLMDLKVEKNRIHVIPNGVDPKRFKPKKPRRQRNDPPKILTVARLDLHKGHDRVLEALLILKKEGLTPSYIIVGEGEEEMRLREVVRSFGLEQQVIFAGFISDSELASMYANSDIFVMASREIPGRLDLIEGFGISFLEASASGLPVVAGCSGGVPDAVRHGETGLLVNPDSPEDIARALRLLLSDTDFAQKLGTEGRRWTETQMSWDHVAKRLCSTMQRLIG